MARINPTVASVRFNGRTHTNESVESTRVQYVMEKDSMDYADGVRRNGIYFAGEAVEWFYEGRLGALGRDTEMTKLLTVDGVPPRTFSASPPDVGDT